MGAGVSAGLLYTGVSEGTESAVSIVQSREASDQSQVVPAEKRRCPNFHLSGA